jgi:hypothetical protein
MAKKPSMIRISKLDAALRQLRTAISLWFNEEDPVSVHTLAYAAYEIIHTISKKRDPNREALLFDSPFVKDEKRSEANKAIKSHANFFKHGDRDGEAVVEFNPELSQWFILYGIRGRELCGEQIALREQVFLWWLYLHNPEILTESGRQAIAEAIPLDASERLRSLTKREFIEVAQQAWRDSTPPAVLIGS